MHKLAKLIREAWFFGMFFFCLGFIGAWEGEGSRMPARLNLVINLTFAFLAAFWVVLDARRRYRAMGYGYPALVFFFWPIFGPLYLFQTRGLWAFLSLFAFVGAFFVIVALGAILGMVVQG